MTEKILEGKLICYSESGMEGGYLSIIDTKYITLSPPLFGISNDRIVFDKNDKTRYGKTSNTEVLLDNTWLPIPDPITKDNDYRISSLFCGEKYGDLKADKRLAEKYHFKIEYTGDGTPNTIPNRPYGIPQFGITRGTVNWNDGSIQHGVSSEDLLIEQWDNRGLHMLKENDILKVLDPRTENIICEKKLNEIPLIVFSQTQKGHFEQDKSGLWENYFIQNNFAELHRE
jgi:hypothetical protein